MSSNTMDVIPLIISALGIVACAVLKYAIDRRDREIDERLKEAKTSDEKQKTADDEQKVKLADEIKAITVKNHAIELAHAKLEGDVKVLTKTSETVDRELKEIKDEMVPRQEWRESTERMESAQSRLEAKIDAFMRSRVQWSPTPAGMQAQRAIPREEGDIDEFKIGKKR